MTNGDHPIKPILIGSRLQTRGLIKREYFAGIAMQGMLANSDKNMSAKGYAEMAVEMADALLAELNKTQQP